jgi:hypothetical protein
MSEEGKQGNSGFTEIAPEEVELAGNRCMKFEDR